MKVSVITGAASGIGLALTRLCLQREQMVVMVDNNSALLNQRSAELSQGFPHQVRALSCDVRNQEEVAQLVAVLTALGRVDWIYNNAGIMGPLAPLWELEPEALHQVMEVNVYGVLHVIRALMPILLSQDHESHLINMASFYSLCSGSQVGAYAMSKHALLALSESLYFDLRRLEKPVRVSVAFPSFTDTALLTSQSADSGGGQPIFGQLLRHARSAEAVAAAVIEAVAAGVFYIFPDKEVKGYCRERTDSILLQGEPNLHPVERLVGALLKRYAST